MARDRAGWSVRVLVLILSCCVDWLGAGAGPGPGIVASASLGAATWSGDEGRRGVHAKRIAPTNIRWKEVNAAALLSSRSSSGLGSDHSSLEVPCSVRADAVRASSLLHKPAPVYVSIATMSSRVQNVSLVVCDLLTGYAVPDHIFVLTSSEPFLLDRGVPHSVLPRPLLALAAMHARKHPNNNRSTHRYQTHNRSNIKNLSHNKKQSDIPKTAVSVSVTIVQTNSSLGPHRKLLPLLSRVWGRDVAVLIMDDDTRVTANYVGLFATQDRLQGGSAIIAGQVRRLGVCAATPSICTSSSHDEGKISGRCDAGVVMPPYNRWAQVTHCERELLVLPVGRGSVLYWPHFFHSIVFDSTLRRLTFSNDDLTFRLATLIKRVPVALVPRAVLHRTDLDPLQNTRMNTTSLFRQKNKGGASNYSNIAQWVAATSYLQSLHLLDYNSLSRVRLLLEREWYCVFLLFFPEWLHPKQCAVVKCSASHEGWGQVAFLLHVVRFYLLGDRVAIVWPYLVPFIALILLLACFMRKFRIPKIVFCGKVET